MFKWRKFVFGCVVYIYVFVYFTSLFFNNESPVKRNEHKKRANKRMEMWEDAIMFNSTRKFHFDSTRPVLYPWKESGNGSGICSEFNVSFILPGSAERILLSSFGGSGNTWTRYLIEGLTGVFTGDIYMNQLPLRNYFLGTRIPYKTATTFVVKSHALDFDKKFFGKNPRKILLVRNPFEAFISNFNLFASGNSKVS